MYGYSDVLILRESDTFVETPYISELTERTVSYLKAGFPLNLSGPAGVGKTTLAFHIAAKIGRPGVLMCGDYEYATSDLVGRMQGFHKKYSRDNFIRSVLKTDESMTQQWVDNRLTTACQFGLTLIYDEFTRSRPEANNVLLSVLEERILTLPNSRGGDSYIKVHPDFRAIFTSNPEEYAGVQKSQDALRDRMVTIEIGNFDEETEISITHEKSGLPFEDCCNIVRLVRKVRESKSNRLTPTIRACIMIGKLVSMKEKATLNGDFRKICIDILMPEVPRNERDTIKRIIDDEVLCSSR
ncbi:MAG: gas vesicle protein GvpN [Dehalococcoidales bacterium]|nr:gas vesicle protein GvpN [Dehalococcoidales bacterium]